MTLCPGSALPVNLARGGTMRPTERRFYKTETEEIILFFKGLITRNIQVRWYSAVQSPPTLPCRWRTVLTFCQGLFGWCNGGIEHYCNHSIYDDESYVGAKIQSAWQYLSGALQPENRQTSLSRSPDSTGKNGNPQLLDFTVGSCQGFFVIPISFKRPRAIANSLAVILCFGSSSLGGRISS